MGAATKELPSNPKRWKPPIVTNQTPAATEGQGKGEPAAEHVQSKNSIEI